MKTSSRISLLALVFFALSPVVAYSVFDDDEDRYDYRKSTAYTEIGGEARDSLDQVHRDLVLLWGALDKWADEHSGELPDSLDELVPGVLHSLPGDPFATEETAAAEDLQGYVASAEGRGNRYRKGAEGNRAWRLASVGLGEFPYLAERGNVGLYVCKGTWISGINPMRMREENKPE